MSNSRRLLVVAVAVIAAVIALVVLKPADDGPLEPPTPTGATTPTGVTSETGATATPAAPAKEKIPKVRVRNGKPVGGPLEIRVQNGERVRFSVSSDTADEVHVHGFDIQKPVTPAKSAKFDFKAAIEGAFEVEMHHSGAVVAEIQVRPKG